MSFPKSVIGNLNLKKADETPDTNPRGWHHAFTLIELLVVVLIIGILSAIALPQYQKAVEKAKMVQMLTRVRSFQITLDEYMLANGFGDSSAYYYMTEDLNITFPGTSGPPHQYCEKDYSFCYITYYESGEYQIYAFRRANGRPGYYCDNGCGYSASWKKSSTDSDWVKTYYQTADAKANLKPDFAAMGYTTN